MIKVKELQASQLYLIVCRSTSHEAFFENVSQLRIFKNQFKRHLDGICDVIEYLHVPSGYAYIIETKSKESIREWYEVKRATSRKRTEASPISELWRIISECFRHMGSTFVSICNRRSGREGAKFRKRFERFAFEDESELQLVTELLRMGKIDLDQKSDQYKMYSKKKKWVKAVKSVKLLRSSLKIGNEEKAVAINGSQGKPKVNLLGRLWKGRFGEILGKRVDHLWVLQC